MVIFSIFLFVIILIFYGVDGSTERQYDTLSSTRNNDSDMMPQIEIGNNPNKKACFSCGTNSLTKKYNNQKSSNLSIDNQILKIDPDATIGPDNASLYREANVKTPYPIPTGPSARPYNFPVRQPGIPQGTRNDQRGAVPYESTTSNKFYDYGPNNLDQRQTGRGELDPKAVGDLTIISPTGEESRVTQKYSFRDLQKYSWADFHQGEGERIQSPGTLPTFGLYVPFNAVPTRECGLVSMKQPYNNSCYKPELALYGSFGG